VLSVLSVTGLVVFSGKVRVDPAQYPKYITGTDRPYCSRKDCLGLKQAYNARYAVEYLFFARILALCRQIKSTIPIRQLYTLGYSAYSCLIGIVDLIGGHSAINLAKSLIVSKKTISIIAHLCSKTHFFAKNPTFRQV
jgi:hypothetical protein